MNKKTIEKFRLKLQGLLELLRGDTQTLEDAVRTGTGGDAGGNLSNAPMHLGDLGTEIYLQELNSTFLERESSLRDEVVAALERLDNDTFGTCEECGRKINANRLEVLPYTRYCAACAELHDNQVNFNVGRAEATENRPFDLYDAEDEGRATTEDNESEILFSDAASRSQSSHIDPHATGTPGGGSAVGGLAGTNVGGGDPGDVDLEAAMGSGEFDVELSIDEDHLQAYSGRAGGAVGGTPADKRGVGKSPG